jgi:alkylation response protein AidB-like acyl-CoA dehydrogenase
MLDLSYFANNDLKNFGEERCGIFTPITKAWISDLSVEKNRGLNYMFTTINEARIRAGGHGLSCAIGALQGAVQYSLDRVQGRPVGMSKEDAKNSTIIDHADVRRMLMTMKAYTDAMRYMLYDNQLMLDLSYFANNDLKNFGEERCGIFTPITKAWISDLSVEKNRGLNYMFTTINEARIRAGGHGLSCAIGALQGAVQYSLDRVQGRPVGMSKEDAKNSTIIDHADVRRMLMTMKAYTDAMRYMLYDNQLMLDLSYFANNDLKNFGEERCGIFTPITKAWISDLSVEKNRGLNYMFTTINEARIRAGGHGLACASGSLQGAAQYARDRVQGRPVGMSKEDAKNSTIIDHADVRRMLMTIKSYVDAMRYLMYDNQLMLDVEYFGEDEEMKSFGEERCGILTPITKGLHFFIFAKIFNIKH